jgi:energy-coupling factor transporter ATP-binding protein EcfA2
MPLTSYNNPFPGLRAFEFADRAFFFGRDLQVLELYNKLVSHRFVAVIGGSGSGKSSLVKAGLGGRLFGDSTDKRPMLRWRGITLRPLGRPLFELARAIVMAQQTASEDQHGFYPDDKSFFELAVGRALARLTKSSDGLVALLGESAINGAECIVLIIDQFEELFRYKGFNQGAEYDERALFVKHLLTASEQNSYPIHVLLTLRSEFIGDCTQFIGLPEAINDSQFLTPRLTREQRREAILRPIELAKGSIAPALLQRLLNDVGNEPDQLPVMQHALMRLWRSAGPERALRADSDGFHA